MNDKVRSGLILGLVALLAGFAGAIVALGAISLMVGDPARRDPNANPDSKSTHLTGIVR